MSNQLFQRVDAIYQYVRRAQAGFDARARPEQRQRELLQVEVVGVEQARVYDLNTVVSAAVAEALPVCQALGVRVRVWQASELPRVTLLVDPLKHTLAGLIDLCIDDEEIDSLLLRTWAEEDSVVASVERKVAGARGGLASWREVSLGARVELLVGAQALRLLGGALSVRQRGREISARIDLPRGDSAIPLGNTITEGEPQRAFTPAVYPLS